MFNKNNIKNILILTLSFFSCSYVYLVQSMTLNKYSNVHFANSVSVLYGSFAMALGILIFSLIFKRTKQIKRYYILFMLLYLVSIITFFTTTNTLIMGIMLCLSCIFGTAGFGSGYSYSLIAENVSLEYQGRVYTIGYALGSILTQIITLVTKYIYNPTFCITVNIVLILSTIYLIYNVKELPIINRENCSKSMKKYLISLAIIVITMAGISAISQEIIGFKTFNNNWFANTRLYYSIGLIISGILYDKKRDVFEVLMLTSFIYPLLSIVLLNQNIPAIIVSGLAYFFLGFFSLFRAFVFISLGTKKKNFIHIAAYGLMIERIVEGTVAIFQKSLMNNYLLSLILEAIFLSIVLWVYIFFYLKKNVQSEDEKIKVLSIKYKLSIQEEKVLMLLLQDLSNQEMADKLFVSINTIRNHVANIYKKTGMKKKEIREKYYYGTK